MTDRKTVEITRYDVVTPDHCNIDEYGNLIIVTKNNQEIKVNKKHIGLHDGIIRAAENGMAIKLGYAVYMNKEYVHTAELYDGSPSDAPEKPPVKRESPVVQKAKEMGTVIDSFDKKDRSMAIAYAKDLCCAGMIELSQISEYGDKFLDYITKRNG